MPPLPPRGTVMVSDAFKGESIVRLMQRHRYIVEEMTGDACDILCGKACVLYISDLNRLSDVAYRGFLSQRISAAKAKYGTTGYSIVILFLVGATDPRPDVLNWLNLQCSVEFHCGVMLCWTEEECANYLEGLTDYSAHSVNFRVGGKKENAPIPILIEAFTQTPPLMGRKDVIRAAHRYGSVADFLTATCEDLSSLPGLGPKKAGRLHTVLHARFHASCHRVADVLPESVELHGNVNETEMASDRISAREKMLEVLNELKCREMDGDSLSDS